MTDRTGVWVVMQRGGEMAGAVRADGILQLLLRDDALVAYVLGGAGQPTVLLRPEMRDPQLGTAVIPCLLAAVDNAAEHTAEGQVVLAPRVEADRWVWGPYKASDLAAAAVS